MALDEAETKRQEQMRSEKQDEQRRPPDNVTERPRKFLVGLLASGLFASSLSPALAAGVKILGYVYSSYAVHDPALLKADIDNYYAWYDVDGIFIDEADNNCLTQPYYADLDAYTKTKGGLGLTVINPGTTTPECFATAAGITKATLKATTKDGATTVAFQVTGRDGLFGVNVAELPLTGALLPFPSQPTSNCATAVFPGPKPSCSAKSNGDKIQCR